MDEHEREQQDEMLRQVARYEDSKRSGLDAWFDSDNYVDIIDWYYQQDMNSEAEQVVCEAFSVFPDDEEIVYRYAGMHAVKGEYEKAEQIIKTALGKYPSDELRIDLASLYVDWGKHSDIALDILRDVESRDKENFFVYMLLGRLYLDDEKYVQAEEYLRKGVELNCNDRMLLGCYADCSYDKSLKETMIRFLYEKTHLYPFNDILWVTLGLVYAQYEFFDEAIEAYDYAIAINPEGEVRHSCKADCLIAKSDYVNAKAELLIALKYSTDDAAELHIMLAGIYMLERDFSNALLHLSEVDKKRESRADKTYLLDLALCLYFTDKVVKARNIIETVISESYFPLEIVVDFARRLYDYGFHEEAEDLFETIITNNMDSTIIELASITLAALKSREGNTFEAIQIMENTLAELHSCTEDFWYAFLRIACQDRKYDNYTTRTLSLLMTLDSFPTYIKEYYPEIVDNPNYKRCLKNIYHV